MKVFGKQGTIKLIIAVAIAVSLFLLAENVFAQTTRYVPDSYPTIQQAINSAASGDAIIVRGGCYSENIAVNVSDLVIKSDSGAGSTTVTAVDTGKPVFELNRSRTEISGFSLQGATGAPAISIKYSSTEDKINNNIFSGNKYGIYVSLYSYLNNISGNVFKDTNDYGLYLQEAYDSGSGATRKSSANRIYLNDFYSKVFVGANNWPYYNHLKTADETNYKYAGGYYKSRLGNYYASYTGTDDNSDGIGDKPQNLVGETDSYPLVRPGSNYEILTEEPEWSFAVLTDLHIGWGIPDYGDEGYDDNAAGQDYYMTERLNRAIEYINQHAATDNIKFVVILGDITDTAERSEFLKAREVLNNLAIPYIPLIGNHDIWPYTSKTNVDPDSRSITVDYPSTEIYFDLNEGIEKEVIAGEPLGDEVFQEIFWTNNISNRGKIFELFDTTFSRQQNDREPFYQNVAFSFNKMAFLGVDFASRIRATIKSFTGNGVFVDKTADWIVEKLENTDNRRIIVMDHYPLRTLGGIKGLDLPFIDSLFPKTNPPVINLAGHTHVSQNRLPQGLNYFNIIESEALSQIGFLNYASEGKYLRIIKISNGNSIDITPDNFATDFIGKKVINPYFIVEPGFVGTGMPIKFIADAKNLEAGSIGRYVWKFGSEPELSIQESTIEHYFESPGLYPVKLTVFDKQGNYESIQWNLKVVQTSLTPAKINLPGAAYGACLGFNYKVDVVKSEFAQNTNEWISIIKKETPVALIGSLNVHFEKAIGDVDLSSLQGDIDFDSNRSLMHVNNWPSIIEASKILYIPSSGLGQVYICPEADSLDEVNPKCNNVTILATGETKKGMTLSEIDYNGQPYYQVYGITGTGGGEMDFGLEDQIEITKLEYDGEDILNSAANDIGDKRQPLLLSELKQDKIDLINYLPYDKKEIWPWEKKILDYKLKFNESIGNEWQGRKLNVWFNFITKQ